MAYPYETYEIILHDQKPYKGSQSYETHESDPVIEKYLPPRRVIYGGGSCGSYVTLPVDYRFKPGREVRLEWFKDRRRVKTGTTTTWSGRSSVRIHSYHNDVQGTYKFRVTDIRTGKCAETEGSVVLG